MRELPALVRRLLAFVALATVTIAIVYGVGVPARAEVRDASLDAMKQLGGPGDCFVRAMVFLDTSDRGGSPVSGSGWIVSGATYRGTAEEAARAFGGEIMSQAASEIWIADSDREGVIVALQLREVAPNVWLRADSIKKIGCSVSEGARE